jgi:hypothetical protein
MMSIKQYHPNRFIGGPRWFELVIHGVLFNMIMVFQSYLGIDVLLGSNSFFFKADCFDWGVVIFTSLLFYFYKVATTHTVIDSILINDNLSTITFNYWLFYVIKKEEIILFSELSFYTNQDLIIFGGTKSLRIYKNNKYKIKLNQRNGWEKKHVDELINEFLVITNGKIRIGNWQPF